VADEKQEHTVAESLTGEKRYPDPYGLYRWWLGASEDGRNEGNEGEVSSTELAQLWRRWFEGTVGSPTVALEAENGFTNSMATLWKEMAEDFSSKMSSGDTLPEDPVRFFLRWYNGAEERWSEAADELLRRNEVLESMGRMFETYARSEAELRQASEERLKNLGAPTRSDVARVAKLVVVVENKVDRIEETLDDLACGDGSEEDVRADALNGLEERIDRLEGKMDRVLVTLDKLVEEDQSLSKTTQSSSPRKEDANESVTPLEGLSLELIEAGYVGAGRWDAVVEGPKTKDED